ncbi:MAG: 50S ribosomal protein L17 [Aeriscardovia sp.]|nr:50S ribosomal protein L17 [Aeriscardovia sp.]MBP5785521.1 50S ribosomal protein L17 [Aeriscardovia sp.]MBQ1286805.1 50S ribosomal protein L17 [Aeriscardovia sp.]MBQ1301622.1 50S ribosomal protein L17 [Aeriscardovia sp.]MBQ1357437.1 50S ribosomal protein L17 [Aeriscardovia sp.]
MPQPKKGPRLASSPAHERLMLANMATSLFRHEEITTTLKRAKRLQPLAERLITFAKGGTLADRRRVMRLIRDKSVVHKLFTDIADRMEGREGGYTRIVKISPRVGDNAPMAIISLVTTESPKAASLKEAETAVKLAEDAAAMSEEKPMEDAGEAVREETAEEAEEKSEAEAEAKPEEEKPEGKEE